MTAAEKLLEMIEAVDPDDTKTLDEIDARVYTYINGAVVFTVVDGNGNDPETGKPLIPGWSDLKEDEQIKDYTRSRDALKSIRPEGWFVSITKFKSGASFASDGFHATWHIDGYLQQQPELPTEELAELHAIIQAIAYERQNYNPKTVDRILTAASAEPVGEFTVEEFDKWLGKR